MDRVPAGTHAWSGRGAVIVFDGACAWCNYWVAFTIARDPRRKFRFGTLQSDQGRQLLALLGLPTERLETFLLIEGERVYSKSTAALRIVKGLSGLWSLLYAAILIPRPLRDALYDAIATYRYALMRPSAECRRPDEREGGRFLS